MRRSRRFHTAIGRFKPLLASARLIALQAKKPRAMKDREDLNNVSGTHAVDDAVSALEELAKFRPLPLRDDAALKGKGDQSVNGVDNGAANRGGIARAVARDEVVNGLQVGDRADGPTDLSHEAKRLRTDS